MSKQQQSRGRANRRYQARKRDFRRCEIPRAWSKAHKGYAATLPRRGETTIDQEIESYSDDISFAAEVNLGPGLKRLRDMRHLAAIEREINSRHWQYVMENCPTPQEREAWRALWAEYDAARSR